jgi:MULE transposase domain
LQQKEDTDLHSWVFNNHLESANGVPPEILVSDRQKSLISSARHTLPLTDHIYCIFHLDDNVTANLRAKVGAEWPNFQCDFWATYRAVSPEEFDRLWSHLIARYAGAREYLEEELYPCQERWAWPWVSSKFTAGVRTNGRVEAENRVSKGLGNAKSTCKELFDALNLRTNGQGVNDMVRIRDVSFAFAICLI